MSGHTPTPWKLYEGDHLLIVNLEGNSLGEMSAGSPYITEREMADNAAIVVRAVNSHEELIRAGEALLATHPVFRSKPMGGEGSQARLQQTDQIEAEDAFRAALAKAKAHD